MKQSAWTKQIASQVTKRGAARASWYCEWDEPDGTRRCKSCGPGPKGKQQAERMAKHVRAELLTNTYSRTAAKPWSEFRQEYESRVLTGLSALTASAVKGSLDVFESTLRLKDKAVEAVTSERMAEFVAARRKAPGKKRGSLISPATVNKDLRHVKAALRVSADWGYLERVPRFRFDREPRTLPRYITPEHFAAIYSECKAATLPDEMHVTASEWWRALLVFAQMTGWRIGEILSLEWADVDLNAGSAVTRAKNNKGKRDETVALHPVVIDHIRPLKTFHDNVFPWEHDRKLLTKHFHAIQDAAGIKLPCRIEREHECTDACHR